MMKREMEMRNLKKLNSRRGGEEGTTVITVVVVVVVRAEGIVIVIIVVMIARERIGNIEESDIITSEELPFEFLMIQNEGMNKCITIQNDSYHPKQSPRVVWGTDDIDGI